MLCTQSISPTSLPRNRVAASLCPQNRNGAGGQGVRGEKIEEQKGDKAARGESLARGRIRGFLDFRVPGVY